MKTLTIKTQTVRVLSSSDLDGVIGGRGRAPKKPDNRFSFWSDIEEPGNKSSKLRGPKR